MSNSRRTWDFFELTILVPMSNRVRYTFYVFVLLIHDESIAIVDFSRYFLMISERSRSTVIIIFIMDIRNRVLFIIKKNKLSKVFRRYFLFTCLCIISSHNFVYSAKKILAQIYIGPRFKF